MTYSKKISIIIVVCICCLLILAVSAVYLVKTPQGQLKLADFYYTGLYVKPNYVKAFNLYRKIATENDNPDAVFMLGLMLKNGEGVNQNIDVAIRYFKLIYNYKDPRVQELLAKNYYEGIDNKINLKQAFKYATQAIEKDNKIKLQYMLADMYLNGKGTQQNLSKGVEYLKQAANQGHVKSIVNLAYIYHKGKFIKQDKTKALGLYKQAMKMQDPDALFALAQMHVLGDSVEQNNTKAIQLFQQAADLGHSKAQYMLAMLYKTGVYGTTNFNQNIQLAKDLLLKAVEKNDADAALEIGFAYYNGNLGFEKDLYKAFNFLTQAYNQGKRGCRLNYILGSMYLNLENVASYKKAFQSLTEVQNCENPEIKFLVANMYEDGLGIKQDILIAVDLYNYLANRNHTKAQYRLGLLYYLGDKNVIRDLKKSYDLIKSAANAGHIKAQTLLGQMYMDGIGPEQNEIKAFEWLSKAANAGDENAQYDLGMLYFKLGDKGYEKSGYWLAQAAKQGHRHALKQLDTVNIALKNKINVDLSAEELYKNALLFYYGEGVNKDLNKSMKLFRMSAKKGYLQAKMMLAQTYYYGKDDITPNHIKALSWYTEAANEGNSKAQARLGVAYYHGSERLQLRPDRRKAFRYLTATSEKEHDANIQATLGLSYLLGRGTEVNCKIAKYWLNKSLEQGNLRAIKTMSLMRGRGDCVLPNTLKSYAYAYFVQQLPVEKQSEEMLEFLDKFEQHMSPEAIQEGRKMSREMFKNLVHIK